MSNPLPTAVLISDIHYSLPTLEVADTVLNMAIDTANDLKVPLIVAGDLHDSKANLRGECISRMLKTFKRANITPFVLVGNHDKIHEKSTDHSLEFLRHLVNLVDKPTKNLIPYWTFIPYQNDLDYLKSYLKTLPSTTKLLMHQGIKGSVSGEYIMDHTALSPSDVDGHRVISGHYHTRQDIDLGSSTWSYIGNPYTLNFGEAKDPAKGFQVLHDDSSLSVVTTNVRKHVVIEIDLGNPPATIPTPQSLDLVWLKITGTSEQLSVLNKSTIESHFGIVGDFRLDLIPLETTSFTEANENLPQNEILDNIIDNLENTDDTRKDRIKALWKTLL